MTDHLHTKHPDGDGWRGLLIPVDASRPIEIVTTTGGWRGLAEIIGASYIERVFTRKMPKLPCGCPAVMIVDETGALTSKPNNPRASQYYLSGGFGICGDAFFVMEGTYMEEEDGMKWPERDFMSLPEEVDTDWPGWKL